MSYDESYSDEDDSSCGKHVQNMWIKAHQKTFWHRRVSMYLWFGVGVGVGMMSALCLVALVLAVAYAEAMRGKVD